MERVRDVFEEAQGQPVSPWTGAHRAELEAAPAGLRKEVLYWTLLGMRTGAPGVDARVDSITRRLLKDIWELRRPLTKAVNETLGRNDLVPGRASERTEAHWIFLLYFLFGFVPPRITAGSDAWSPHASLLAVMRGGK